MASQASKKFTNRTSSRTTKPKIQKNKSKQDTKNIKNKNHPSKDSSLSMVQYEIIIMLILAVALFIMISIYLKGGGLIGQAVRGVFFGTFGIAAWFMPLAIFVASFLKVFNKGNERLNIKILLSFLLIAFFAVGAHVFYVEFPQINISLMKKWAIFASLANYFKVSAGYQVGGGFIGALIGDLLLFLLGKIATMVVIVVITISLLIAITEQSFLLLVKTIYFNIVNLIVKVIHIIEIKTEEHKKEQERKAVEEIAIRKSEAQQLKETQIANQVAKPSKSADSEIDEGAKKTSKKKNFVASLFKSTLEQEDDYDIVKHIEQKEEQEQRQKEAMFTGLFDQAERQEDNKTSVGQEVESTQGEVLNHVLTDALSFPKGDEFKPIVDTKEIRETKGIKPKGKPEEPIVSKEVIEQEILQEVVKVEKTYKTPPIELLKKNPDIGNNHLENNLEENARKLEETLASFGVGARVVDVAMGPTVTRYELQPDQGVKVSKIVNLADDIALNLAASGIRIEAPIPGKSAVGIEVPNKVVSSVFLSEVLDTKEFDEFPSKLAFGLGKDISGKVIVTDIARMPHLLIAGATGSGKSVCVNTLITSILYKSSPEDVKLLMIDPKVVELSIYNGIPHLLIPVVTDPKKAAGALNWAVQEMLDRYKLFAAANVRDIKGYNKAILGNADGLKKLPQVVIIVDELADLMVAAQGEVEEAICRLAQMARAAGLHLIIATQRPSVDVITGLIKANIPSRIAFNVSSGVDSRTIIDMNGAEKLLGKGDMLFYPVGLQKPVRIQGAFISDKEVENIVAFLKDRKKEDYDQKIMMQLDKTVSEKDVVSEEYDPIFEEALELCIDKEKASASMIQRRFRVGYNRAARILDQLNDAGYVSDEEGSKPRRVLISKAEFEALKARANGEDVIEEEVDDQVAEISQTQEVTKKQGLDDTLDDGSQLDIENL